MSSKLNETEIVLGEGGEVVGMADFLKMFGLGKSEIEGVELRNELSNKILPIIPSLLRVAKENIPSWTKSMRISEAEFYDIIHFRIERFSTKRLKEVVCNNSELLQDLT